MTRSQPKYPCWPCRRENSSRRESSPGRRWPRPLIPAMSRVITGGRRSPEISPPAWQGSACRTRQSADGGGHQHHVETFTQRRHGAPAEVLGEVPCSLTTMLLRAENFSQRFPLSIPSRYFSRVGTTDLRIPATRGRSAAARWHRAFMASPETVFPQRS